MGKITSISYQEKDKERCNLYIDEQFRCGLSIDIVYKYGLKVNEEISEQKLSEIILEALNTLASALILNKILVHIGKINNNKIS